MAYVDDHLHFDNEEDISTIRDVSDVTEQMYKQIVADVSAVSMNRPVVSRPYDIYFHVWPPKRNVRMDTLIRQGIEKNVFSRLASLLLVFNTKYETIVNDKYGKKSPLRFMDLPGKHIIIGLFARYILNINSLPLDFASYIHILAGSSLADKEYNMPYDLNTRAQEWNDTTLFPKYVKDVSGTTYTSDMTSNVDILDGLVAVLERRQDVLEHVLHNIIKGRFTARKIFKIKEQNEHAVKYYNQRGDLIDRYYRVREWSEKNNKVRNLVSLVQNSPLHLVNTNRTGYTPILDDTSIRRNITGFLSHAENLNDTLFTKYMGIYEMHIQSLEEYINRNSKSN